MSDLSTIPPRDEAALHALLDGELAPGAELALRERLAREPALAERLSELARVDAALRASAELVPPLSPQRRAVLRRGLQRRIDAAAPRAGRVIRLRQRARLLVPLAAAAGLALYFGLAQAPAPPTAAEGELLASVSDEELLIAIEYDTLEDYDVVEQLDLLEMLVALDTSGGAL